MQLTPSFVELLQHFLPVFTSPTHLTFVQILTGWVLSHRHRYVTEVIFASGNVRQGHWWAGVAEVGGKCVHFGVV